MKFHFPESHVHMARVETGLDQGWMHPPGRPEAVQPPLSQLPFPGRAKLGRSWIGPLGLRMAF